MVDGLARGHDRRSRCACLNAAAVSHDPPDRSFSKSETSSGRSNSLNLGLGAPPTCLESPGFRPERSPKRKSCQKCPIGGLVLPTYRAAHRGCDDKREHHHDHAPSPRPHHSAQTEKIGRQNRSRRWVGDGCHRADRCHGQRGLRTAGPPKPNHNRNPAPHTAPSGKDRIRPL